MFKILVATDGSDCACKAAEFAGLLSRKIGEAEITFLSVIDTGVIAQASVHPSAMSLTLFEEMEKAMSEALQDAQKRLEWTSKKTVARLERGVPAMVICGLAEAEEFDLIVMGARGHGRVADILLGSVSDKVMHKARVPVLITRDVPRQGD
ncbi:MAG: universal stress protein [Dehalococcoidia bacterium]|nr:universal stress protein [Dehalococcoidia bacterium]